MNHLRRWSQAILLPREGDDEDHDDEDRHNPDRMLLRSCVLQLDNLGASLNPATSSCKVRRPGGKGVQFSGAALVECFRAAMCLKSRGSLSDVIDRALRICMPTCVDECLSALKAGKVYLRDWSAERGLFGSPSPWNTALSRPPRTAWGMMPARMD